MQENYSNVIRIKKPLENFFKTFINSNKVTFKGNGRNVFVDNIVIPDEILEVDKEKYITISFSLNNHQEDDVLYSVFQMLKSVNGYTYLKPKQELLDKELIKKYYDPNIKSCRFTGIPIFNKDNTKLLYTITGDVNEIALVESGVKECRYTAELIIKLNKMN